MLWDVVYEFYIRYIFGGFFNGTAYVAKIGRFYNVNSGTYNEYGDTANFVIAPDIFHAFGLNGQYTLPIGNYLSLIATIITMVVILVLCCALIKKIYNMCAHIIG